MQPGGFNGKHADVRLAVGTHHCGGVFFTVIQGHLKAAAVGDHMGTGHNIGLAVRFLHNYAGALAAGLLVVTAVGAAIGAVAVEVAVGILLGIDGNTHTGVHGFFGYAGNSQVAAVVLGCHAAAADGLGVRSAVLRGGGAVCFFFLIPGEYAGGCQYNAGNGDHHAHHQHAHHDGNGLFVLLFFRLARLRRLCGRAVSLAGGLCLGGMVSGTGLLAVIGCAGLVAAVVGVDRWCRCRRWAAFGAAPAGVVCNRCPVVDMAYSRCSVGCPPAGAGCRLSGSVHSRSCFFCSFFIDGGECLG